MRPVIFQAVGLWYLHFDQTSNDEVRRLLREARDRPIGLTAAGSAPPGADA